MLNRKIIKTVILLVICLIFVYLLKNLVQINYESYELRAEANNNVSNKPGDNLTGYPIDIVPNIVHYVLFTIHKIEIAHFISILSVLKNHRPEKIMIHCDCDQLEGDYWERVLKIAEKTSTIIKVRRVERIKQIFGIKFNEKWIDWHASDVTRIKVLQEFGGIYLDRDMYVVKSLNEFLKYKMTVSWNLGLNLGSQILIGHKNARFLNLYIEIYHYYDSIQWYYNAGQLPRKMILHKKPELVHRIMDWFSDNGDKLCPIVFNKILSQLERRVPYNTS